MAAVIAVVAVIGMGTTARATRCMAGMRIGRSMAGVRARGVALVGNM